MRTITTRDNFCHLGRATELVVGVDLGQLPGPPGVQTMENVLEKIAALEGGPGAAARGVHRVRVGGTGRVYEPDQLIEAHRIDAQVWLTDIPGSSTWKRVHCKFPSSFRIPAHLRQTV